LAYLERILKLLLLIFFCLGGEMKVDERTIEGMKSQADGGVVLVVMSCVDKN
jgi:hypothetical protein